MNGGFIKWLWFSDSGSVVRVACGVTFFIVLTMWDLHRHGRQAQRWREYVLLLSAVAAAVAYGIVNDQVTSAVSWEYFYYGKEGYLALGEQTPPDRPALCLQAAKVGAKATWTAGLVFGVAILLANNPRRGLPRLGYGRLYRLLPLVLAAAAVCGLAVGLLGYFGAFSGAFPEIVQAGLWRPRRFMAAWSAHLGGYIGGFAGTAAAVCMVIRQRRRLRAANQSDPPEVPA